jgi:exodeoxyribonuclease VIII
MHTVKYDEIDALNWSTLVHMATSAKLLAWRKDHPREETKALRMGTAIHCAVLEPERFARSYLAQPDLGDGRTKAGKEARAAWDASRDPSAIVLDADEHELVVRCATATREHHAVRELLRGGHAEQVLTWTDEETGLACKGRLDYLAPAYLIDLKSMRAETLGAFAREVAGRLYHGQLAWYLDGAIASKRVDALASQVICIGIQTVEPYDVVPGRIMPEDIERGRALYRGLLRRYVECRAANWWPGLAPGVVNLQLPMWAAGGEPEEGDTW